MVSKRILVIASWGGERRHNVPTPWEMLEEQLWSLDHFKHHLDKVVVVTTSEPEGQYADALAKFETVLYRPNIHGSYGSWNHAWYTYGDEYDWYFVTEDDYVFVMDDFDQKLIDLFSSDMGYLCSLIKANHAAMSGGLVSSAGFRAADFRDFETCTGAYDPDCQIKWGRAFMDSPLGVGQIAPAYDVPYYGGGGSFVGPFSSNPAIIAPVQMVGKFKTPAVEFVLNSYITRTEVFQREIMEDAHRWKLMHDPWYRSQFVLDESGNVIL